jgi:AraC-like DNA-binding protein
MLTGHRFERINDLPLAEAGRPDQAPPLNRLSRRIIEQFERFSELRLVFTSINAVDQENADEVSGPPTHPACETFSSTKYCCESWQLHLMELRARPRTHWHRCDYGRLCAVAPLCWEGRCLGAIKMVCSDSMPETEFAHHVELLDAIVERIMDRAIRPMQEARQLTAATDRASNVEAPDCSRPDHQPPLQITSAVQCIEKQLSDPNLSVSGIAQQLGVNPDYLAHLFVQHTGERMGRYIAARRVVRARNLLAATSWPVKRIAIEAGFANRNWFHHVFRAHTGATPTEYRRNQSSDKPYCVKTA